MAYFEIIGNLNFFKLIPRVNHCTKVRIYIYIYSSKVRKSLKGGKGGLLSRISRPSITHSFPLFFFSTPLGRRYIQLQPIEFANNWMNFDPAWYRELLMDWRASIIPRIGRFHGIYKSTFEEVVFNPDIKNSLVVQMIPSKIN